MGVWVSELVKEHRRERGCQGHNHAGAWLKSSRNVMLLPSQPQPKDTDFYGTSDVVRNVAKQQS